MSQPQREPAPAGFDATPRDPAAPDPTQRGLAPDGPAATASRTGSSPDDAPQGTRSEEVVERLLLAEEEALLEIRRRSTGRVRVRTEVETTDEHIRAELTEEDVIVERVPVNEYVDAVPAIRADGDVTIVPVFEEVLVVEKRLFLKEELHLRRVRKVEAVEVPVTLRRTRAVVEKVPPEPEAAPSGEFQAQEFQTPKSQV